MSNINPNPFTTRPEIDGTFGVCTSTHWIATAVGMSILERGGNAFDAAVATAFTLQVVEPHLNGPGGDVPVIVHDTRKGKDKIEVICGQGPAPMGATIAHYKSLGLDLVPGTGLLACCVPGTFETWMLLLRDYGTVSLADVLKPAIYYAGEGQPLVERASFTIGTVEQLFREHWPTSAAVYLPGGKVPAPGMLFANKQLAETYSRILREAESVGGNRDKQIEHARKMWSQGFVAEAIDRFCRTQELMDSSGERHRGVLTADDMARFAPRVEAPVTYQYGRYTVCKGGFWSQGPAVLQQLALLKGFDLDGADPTSADFIHTVVECSKLAYADRETFYGDPDFVKVPGDVLLSDAYADARRKLVGKEASMEQRPGNIPGFGMRLDIRVPGGQRLAAPGAGEPTVGRSRRGRMTTSTIRTSSPWATAASSNAPASCAATPCISTSSTATATWCRRRRPAAGCNPRRRFRSSASASAAAPSSSGSTRATRTRSGPASGRASRSRRPWRCATAIRISPGARPAATSRTSGCCRCSCATSIAA